EVNVRTYVYDKQGIPGIWFYSLDINSLIAAKIGRIGFSLPYFFANLKQINSNQNFIIQDSRIEKPKADMVFSYEPTGDMSHNAEIGSLDFFLIERYVLFSFKYKQLKFLRVYHKPYFLKNVIVNEYKNSLLESNGFNISKPADLVHYSPGVSVEIFR